MSAFRVAVVYKLGVRQFGFARLEDGREVYFSFRDYVFFEATDEEHPLVWNIPLTEQLFEGSEIVVAVRQGPQGLYATSWGSKKDYQAVIQEMLEDAQAMHQGVKAGPPDVWSALREWRWRNASSRLARQAKALAVS